MRISVEKLSSTKRNLTIEESSEIIDQEESKIISEIASTHSFPGFRKGKAPVSMIRKLYENDIAETSLNNVINDLSHKAIEKENLAPIGNIEEKNVKIENGMLSFTITFEVLPEIQDTPLENLEIEKPVYAVNDTLVEKRLDLVRERSSFLVSVQRESQKEDFLLCDFSVKDEDGNVLDDLSFKEKMLVINENSFWKGFHENLVGRNKDARCNFEFMVPEEDSKYGGKKLLFNILIKEIKQKALPELNDELAKEFNFNSLEEMKNDIEKNLAEELSRKSEIDFENNIMKSLEESYNFETPLSLIEIETKEMISSLKKHFDIDNNRDSLRSEIDESARKRVKQNLILDHLAEKLHVEVSDDELKENLIKTISNEVGYDNLSRPTIKSKLNDTKFIREIYSRVKRTKTLDEIKKMIKLKEVRENEPQ
ncbi:trigger factor [candidate division WOR-3 bacterium]|nr:trigger factor [candidate division WOR-3 bacterium]